jgi:hypothetical protein
MRRLKHALWHKIASFISATEPIVSQNRINESNILIPLLWMMAKNRMQCVLRKRDILWPCASEDNKQIIIIIFISVGKIIFLIFLIGWELAINFFPFLIATQLPHFGKDGVVAFSHFFVDYLVEAKQRQMKHVYIKKYIASRCPRFLLR